MGKEGGPRASFRTLANAASFEEIVFICTQGSASLQKLHQAGSENQDGKILINTVNPLDYSTEIWTSTVSNTDSLGE